MASPIETHHITIRRGQTWQEVWWRTGVSTITGWSSAVDIRDRTGLRLLRLASTGTGIVLSSDGEKLIAVITITEAQSLAFPIDSLYYDWRLIRPGGDVEYLLAGNITVAASITQAT